MAKNCTSQRRVSVMRIKYCAHNRHTRATSEPRKCKPALTDSKSKFERIERCRGTGLRDYPLITARNVAAPNEGGSEAGGDLMHQPRKTPCNLRAEPEVLKSIGEDSKRNGTASSPGGKLIT
jgi:hypothetical protein